MRGKARDKLPDAISDRLADPVFMQAANGWLAVAWFIAAFPIMLFFANSVAFLVFISVYAVVAGHWSAWQAARTEVEQMAAKERE